MRVNAVVVDLGLLGPGAWDFLERLTAALPGHGRRRLHRPHERLAARARPARGRRRLDHEAVPPGGGARARRGRGPAPQAGVRADRYRPAGGRRARDPRRPVPGFRPRPQRGPHAPRVRAAPAARPGAGQGAPARGDLPGRLGLRDGSRRPLRGRVRPQGPPEARDRLARTGATSTRTSAWATASSRNARAAPRKRPPSRRASPSRRRRPAPAEVAEELPPDPETDTAARGRSPARWPATSRATRAKLSQTRRGSLGQSRDRRPGPSAPQHQCDHGQPYRRALVLVALVLRGRRGRRLGGRVRARRRSPEVSVTCGAGSSASGAPDPANDLAALL